MKAPTSKHSTERQIWGARGEVLALEHLVAAGLKHRASNVRYKGGELDLVMVEESGTGKILVFVEVRMRAGRTYGGAAASIDAAKQRRLIIAAEHYLQDYFASQPPPCRFDVVTIDGNENIEWLRDAFDGR